VLERIITSGKRTRDLGGELGCAAFGAEVRSELERALQAQEVRA
jgi:hypothetical protein